MSSLVPPTHVKDLRKAWVAKCDELNKALYHHELARKLLLDVEAHFQAAAKTGSLARKQPGPCTFKYMSLDTLDNVWELVEPVLTRQGYMAGKATSCSEDDPCIRIVVDAIF